MPFRCGAKHGTMPGTIYVGIVTADSATQAKLALIEKLKLSRKYSYELIKARLRPNTSNRWYVEILCKKKEEVAKC